MDLRHLRYFLAVAEEGHYEAHDVHEHLFIMLTQKLGDKCHIAYRSGSTLSTLAMAATGLGLALIPAPVQQVAIPGLVYRPLNEPDLTANLLLISRRHAPSASVNAYLTTCGFDT